MASLSTQFSALLQGFMETYIKSVYEVCYGRFSSWDMADAYQGALKCIPLFNAEIQRLDYRRILDSNPEFRELFQRNFQDFLEETRTIKNFRGDVDAQASFFLHGFLSHVSEKLLMYRRALPIVECISETDRNALTRQAITLALGKTASHFVPLNWVDSLAASQAESRIAESRIADKVAMPRAITPDLPIFEEISRRETEEHGNFGEMAKSVVSQAKESQIEDDIMPEDSVSNCGIRRHEAEKEEADAIVVV